MTSPVDTSVKYFHSGMTGAPVLSGAIGAMIAVLDACLVNGFALKTVDSLVVAANVATITVSTGITAEVGAVVLIAGATPAALNGEQKITAIGANSASFATTGITDQTATGTISVKMAPAGWAKAFSGTNLAAYKSTDVAATGHYLRVDDTLTKNVRVVGYETMTDVNTGTGAFPTAVQRSGGSWWTKSNVADTSARPWMLISDGRFFIFARTAYAANISNEVTAFGDYISLKSGDTYCCSLNGQTSDSSVFGGAQSDDNLWGSIGNAASEFYTSRTYTGVGSSEQLRKAFAVPFCYSVSFQSGKGTAPYPNPVDGGLYVAPQYLSENSNFSLRGITPGVYGSGQAIPNNQFATRDSVTGVSGLPGRVLKALTCHTTSPYGVMFVDITGPWR